MPLPTIPNFPFPPVRSVEAVAVLYENPQAVKFLADLKRTRDEVNALIQEFNKRGSAEAALAEAEQIRTEATEYRNRCREQGDALLKDAAAQVAAAQEKAEHAVRRSQIELRKVVSDTRQAEKELKEVRDAVVEVREDAARELERGRDEVRRELKAAESLRLEYEYKLEKLRNAMSAAS